jgi:RNA polymerase sigma factor (sigma-70 family)
VGEPARNEAALVLACADGDRDAWEAFVRGYGPLLRALGRRMLLRRTGRAADADVEEVVSQVFVALCRGERRLLRRYRPEFRLSTYLGVICRTEVGKMLRKKALPSVATDFGDGSSRADRADESTESPLSALEQRERTGALEEVHRALAHLGTRDRLLISLRFLDGLDYGRIAAVLRVAPESVGQLLHRAKERLARLVPHLAHWVDSRKP